LRRLFFADNGRDTRCGVQSVGGARLRPAGCAAARRGGSKSLPRWFSSQSGKAFTPETAESGLFAPLQNLMFCAQPFFCAAGGQNGISHRLHKLFKKKKITTFFQIIV